MAKEYIEREAVLAEYDRQHNGEPGGARKIIAEFPAADAREVVRGRWKGEGLNDYRCSLCDHVTFGKPNFCPNCGADMREAQDVCAGDSCPITYSADEFFSAERSDGR